MIRRALLIVLALAALTAFPFPGPGRAPWGGGGGGGGGVVASLTCRRLDGTEVSTGGTITLHYAEPLTCRSVGSTINGVPVNDTGFVADAWFTWNFNDSSLGTVTRGGWVIDLGTMYGHSATHAFKPTSFADSCGGGTNHAYNVSLTVNGLNGGSRISDAKSITACVLNPDVDYAGTATICYHDAAGLGSGCPVGALDGGDITATAHVGLRKAELDGSPRRVLFKGGVTFSTGSAGLSVSNIASYVGSYGTGRAVIKFTSTSTTGTAIDATGAGCKGYILDNLTFASSVASDGAGALRLFSAGQNTGCLAVVESGVSQVATERFGAAFINDTSAGLTTSRDIHFIKFDFDQSNRGLAQFYIWGSYVSFVGGTVRGIQNNVGEHNIRFPQWDHIVVAAMKFDDQDDGHENVAMRHDCGTTNPCNHFLKTQFATFDRNEINQDSCVGACPQGGGVNAIEFLASGSGSNEATKNYDVDLIGLVFKKSPPIDNKPKFSVTMNSTTAGGEARRFRFWYSAVDAEMYDATATDALNNREAGPVLADFAYFGNVVWGGTTARTYGISGFNGSGFTAKNNLCVETGAGSCDLFVSQAEDTSNNFSLPADPWDGSAGVPSQGDAFDVTQLQITTANTVLRCKGVITAAPVDLFGNALNTGCYNVGLDGR